MVLLAAGSDTREAERLAARIALFGVALLAVRLAVEHDGACKHVKRQSDVLQIGENQGNNQIK